MAKLLSIAFGGALGALFRYWISGMAYRVCSNGFPWGTLAVNLGGSLLIGLMWSLCETTPIAQNIRLFVLVGFLGSFTTFSTFALENLHLIRDGEYWLAFYNIVLSVLIGLGLVFAGLLAGRLVVGILK